jgi:Putative Flp pilus-assembly TadE/G-like
MTTHRPTPLRQSDPDAGSVRVAGRCSVRGANRRGIAGVWLLLSIPVFVAVLGFVLNIGFLWIAEADLENAAASGALAGAKALGDGQPADSVDEQAVAAAREFISSNSVQGKKIALGRSKKQPNRSRCRGAILLGKVDGRTFRAARDGNAKNACYVHLACKVDGPLGWLTGPKILRCSATAVVGGDGRPRLVEINRVRRDD